MDGSSCTTLSNPEDYDQGICEPTYTWYGDVPGIDFSWHSGDPFCAGNQAVNEDYVTGPNYGSTLDFP